MNVLKVYDSPPKHWQKYDMCLVLPVEANSSKIRGDAIVALKNLARMIGRKYVYVYYSDDGRQVYVLIRAGLKFLRAKAQSEHWQLQLDEEASRNAAHSGDNENLVDSFSVMHLPEVTKLEPFEHLFVDFHGQAELEPLYKRSPHMKHPFHKALRIKMLFDFFDKNSSTEQEMAVDKLKGSGTVRQVFAIHYLRERDDLALHLLPYAPIKYPFDLIQHYYGEEITMYFAFIGKPLAFLLFLRFLPRLVSVVF